jgi:hypothetical protein
MRAQGRNSFHHHARFNCGYYQEIDHCEHHQEVGWQQFELVFEEESFLFRSISFAFEEEFAVVGGISVRVAIGFAERIGVSRI